MTTSYYKAQFSNGQTETRSTTTRKYSHAFLASGYRESAQPSFRTWRVFGFASSEALARKAADYEAKRRHGVTEFSEVAPAVPIDEREYRAISTANRERRATLPAGRGTRDENLQKEAS